MLFNSLNFAIFLPIVYFFYWFLLSKKIKNQNILLLIASYFFYSCWDWRFLFLLIFSTLLDYFTGIKMSDTLRVERKKMWFWISIVINLGFLGVFKYYNFFSNSFSELLLNFGLKVSVTTLDIVLPVGISFYTFHGLSYVIDIYKGRIKAERNLIDYSLFVSFFPLLVAGPIERATHLLPQLKMKKIFNREKTIDGFRQILWGLFKKIVIADQCAEYANLIFNNSAEYSGSTLLLGAVFFSFQIYGDFSGYSDIALGTARLFGIELLKNFSFPYFSRDIAEFWRRWHISLSTWFRDYVYIPLGGSSGFLKVKIRNTFVIFILSGFWHGANWTFIVWGILNALYFLPLMLLKKNRVNKEIVAHDRLLPNVKEMFQILFTFFMTTLAWVFFRSENLTQAISFIFNIFNKSLFLKPVISPVYLYILIGFFICVEWIQRKKNHGLEFNSSNNKYLIFRWLFYFLLAFLIFILNGKKENFIYFQF